MIDNNRARQEVKLLKATDNLTYLQFGEMIGISKNSVYSWICGRFDLGPERLAIAEETIANLKGE